MKQSPTRTKDEKDDEQISLGEAVSATQLRAEREWLKLMY